MLVSNKACMSHRLEGPFDMDHGLLQFNGLISLVVNSTKG